MKVSEYTPWVKSEAILGDYVSSYANREDVRNAMHIPSDLLGWDACSSTIEYYM